MTNNPSDNPASNPWPADSARPEDDRLKYMAALSMALLWDAMRITADVVPVPHDQVLLVTLLDHIASNVLHPALAELPEETWYSTGWPVVTREDLGPDCGCCYTHVWHFERDHEANRPRELLARPCPRGGQHRLIVLGPGEIETLHEGGVSRAG